MTEEKVSRRGYVKYVGGIVVVAVVAAAGYGIYQATLPPPTTPTPTPTPTPTVTPPAAVKLVMQLAAVAGENDAVVDAAKMWNEKYAGKTGIQTETSVVSLEGYFDKVTSQLVSGLATPDIIYSFHYFVGQYSSYSQPLNQYFSDPSLFSSPEGQKYDLNDLLPSALQAMGYKDEKYFFTNYLSGLVLIYRSDLIPKPPETWDELLEVAKKFTKSRTSSSPTTYGFACITRDTEGWKTWLTSYWPNGGTYFEPGTYIPAFGGDAALAAAKTFTTMAREKVIPPDIQTWHYEETLSAMQSGKVAMVVNFHPSFTVLKDQGASPLVFDKVDVAPVPGVKQSDGSIKKVGYGGYNGVFVNKASKHPKEAFKFLSWLVFGDGAKYRGLEKKFTVPLKSVLENPSLDPMLKKILGALQYAGAEPSYPDLPSVQARGTEMVYKMFAGEEDPAKIVKELQDKIYALLKEKGYF